MERDANYTLVGFVSLILLIGMVAFIVWLGRWQFSQENQFYDIVFIGPVTGLPEGGEVQFNGIKVGEVTDLKLDAADPNRVIASARVDAEVPVRADSYATLEPLGITGVSFIQITAGTPSQPLLKNITPEDEIPVIPTQPSILSDLLEGGGTVLARAVEAMDQITILLSNENIENVSQSIEDLNAIMANFRENTDVFDNASSALASIDQSAQEITGLANDMRGLVQGDGAEALADAADAADELRAAAEEARTMIAALSGPATDFAASSLPEAQEAISSLQSAANSLDRLVAEIENDPRSLLLKDPARELEVAP